MLHPLEKKQISLISYAKSDFSVNKNLKREEEASDTDGAAILTSHTDPKANHLSINYIRFSSKLLSEFHILTIQNFIFSVIQLFYVKT